jgi:ribosomal protein S18 acetylase RimI-like enzyme
MEQRTTLTIRPPAHDKEIREAAGLMAGTDPWITLRITAGELEKNLTDPLYETFLAVSGNEVAGVAVIQMKGSCTGYLKNLAVKENWRNRHVGSLLMDFIEKRIFSVHPNVFLCVSSFNEAAKRFYLRRGYHEIGVLTDYLVEGYDEVFMRKTRGPILRNKTNE